MPLLMAPASERPASLTPASERGSLAPGTALTLHLCVGRKPALRMVPSRAPGRHHLARASSPPTNGMGVVDVSQWCLRPLQHQHAPPFPGLQVFVLKNPRPPHLEQVFPGICMQSGKP